MKLFQVTQVYFGRGGFMPHRIGLNRSMLIGHTLSFTGVVSSVLFIINAKTVKELTDSIYISATIVSTVLCYAITVLKEAELFDYFEQFEKNVTTRIENSPESKAVHQHYNQLVEKLCKILYFLFVNVTTPVFLLPKAILSFYLYFNTDAGADAFELPLPLWFPFDWRNPIGYLIAVVIQFFFTQRAFKMVASLCCTTLVSYFLSTTLAKDIDGDLYLINESVKARKPVPHIFKQMSEFVRAHSNGKLLLESYSDVYENLLTIMFTFSLLTICVAMLLIQMQISNNNVNSVLFFIAILYSVWSFGIVAFGCELGQRVTDAMDEISDSVVQQDWYLYPIEIQRLLPMIIVNANKVVECKCFGNISCSRETFKKVVNKSYSYFMVLRRFY